MSALAIRWCIGLAVLAGLLVSSFVAGDNYRDNAWLAKQAGVERKANADYQAEVKRGDEASGAFLVEHQAMQSNFQTLTEKFNGLKKRAPLVVAAVPSVGCIGGLASPPPPTLADANGISDGGSPRLTAGALWMWNSALTGTDQPAGSCGAANTATAACALETEATVDDAWANHTVNAKRCAEDRLVHRRLVDFLKRKKEPQDEN